MKMDKLIACAAIPVLVLGLAACDNNKKKPEPTAAAAPAPAMGAMELEGVKISATVIMTDSANREVRLKWDDGSVHTYRLGPQAINFDQIKVGDRVHAAVAEEVAVYIGPGNIPPEAAAGTVVARAPKGSKPGVVAADTVVINAKITAIDAKARTVTLVGPLGNSRTVRVDPRVDMTQLRVGDDVAARVTEAVAIWVDRPN